MGYPQISQLKKANVYSFTAFLYSVIITPFIKNYTVGAYCCTPLRHDGTSFISKYTVGTYHDMSLRIRSTFGQHEPVNNVVLRLLKNFMDQFKGVVK